MDFIYRLRGISRTTDAIQVHFHNAKGDLDFTAAGESDNLAATVNYKEVYDLVRDAVYTATDTEPLVIPEEAVVVAGARPIQHGKGKDWGISLYTPVIVKYRDARTDSKIQLEDLLR